MEIGEIFTGEIVDLTEEGQGIIKERGKVIFTDGGVIGDFVSVYIKDKKKRFFIGEILDIIQKSDKRIPSDCPVFGICGGCDFREMAYSEEVYLKKSFIIKAFKNVAKVDDFSLDKFYPAEKIIGYRNNVQLPISFDGDLKIGFYKKKSKEIVEFEECKLISKSVNGFIKDFKDFLMAKISKQDLSNLKEIIIRTNEEGDILIILKTLKICFEDNHIIKDYLDSKDISAYEETNNGKRLIHLTGKKKLKEKLLGRDFYYSPKAFFQVNTKQAQVLYNKVLEIADFQGQDIVMELYSGIGGMAILAADKVNEVVGIEIIKSAIEDAKDNARLNKLDNLKFISGDVKYTYEENFKKFKPNKIIVDPPRKGLDKEVLEQIADSKIKQLIYVSCNPQTMARDIKYLMKNNFELEKVLGVDMFPRTGHVETIALIQKM